MASYDQIKNNIVSPAKRTAQATEQWLAKLPNIPQWAYLPGYVTIAMLKQPFKAALKNPGAVLAATAGAATAAAVILGPPGVAALILAGAAAVITYAVVAAVICGILAAFNVYNSRTAIAKAFVQVLAAM